MHAEQKINHKQALFQICHVCGWHGLGLREDGTECGSNFQKLLRIKAKDDSNLADYPDIQNEITKFFGNHMLQSIT